MSSAFSVAEVDLRIVYDSHTLDWARFHFASTHLAFQDFPDPLKKKLRLFMKKTQRGGTQTSSFDVRRKRFPLYVDGYPCELRVFGRDQDVFDAFVLAAWWMLYIKNRRNATPPVFVDELPDDQYFWRCPDCRAHVHEDREHCLNPQCPSWDKLHACTGNTILTPISKRA